MIALYLTPWHQLNIFQNVYLLKTSHFVFSVREKSFYTLKVFDKKYDEVQGSVNSGDY